MTSSFWFLTCPPGMAVGKLADFMPGGFMQGGFMPGGFMPGGQVWCLSPAACV